jgi:hypothetical protein
MMLLINPVSERVGLILVKLFYVLLEIYNLLPTEKLIQIEVFIQEKNVLRLK